MAQQFLGVGVALGRELALGENELLVFDLPFADKVLALLQLAGRSLKNLELALRGSASGERARGDVGLDDR